MVRLKKSVERIKDLFLLDEVSIANLTEKIGALDAGLSFSVVAALRNRLVHSYPDDPRRQAEVLNRVYERCRTSSPPPKA